MELKVIAYARNGHTDKFGIPRQSRDESPILTRIVFEPEYSVPEALRGIEGYSHLWILWGFHKVESQEPKADGLNWSPTVRPPRLGGNKRVGVFATRSPFRPNPIGLSSVKLLKIAYPRPLPEGKGDSLELLVSGADLMDGTPIYDIKPYLSFSDSHPDAKNGFAEETKDYRLEISEKTYESHKNHIRITYESHKNGICKQADERVFDNKEKWGEEWPTEEVMRDIEYILSQDPRPAYQDDPEREYKMEYKGYRVTFCVQERTVVVKKIEHLPPKSYNK